MVGSEVLFVYGTLMRGAPAHARVASAVRVEPAWLVGRLWDTGRGYPAVVDAPAADGARVRGEALFFEDLGRVLPALDAYEGYDPRAPEASLYLRARRPIVLASPASDPEAARTVEAWVYLWPAEREARLAAAGARPIPGGCWKNAWTSAP